MFIWRYKAVWNRFTANMSKLIDCVRPSIQAGGMNRTTSWFQAMAFRPLRDGRFAQAEIMLVLGTGRRRLPWGSPRAPHGSWIN